MFSFEVTILGASGGPDAGATQCFMVRPDGLRDLRSVCVDGGAGVGQITQMLAQSKDCLRSGLLESFYLNDFEPVDQFLDSRTEVALGFPNYVTIMLEGTSLDSVKLNTSAKALKVYRGVREYYITHAHLDHIAAMVLNSPLVYDGDCPGDKLIWGLPFTVDAIKKHIFNDLIWPDLLNGDASRLKLNSLPNEERHSCETFPQWDILPFKVHHGIGAAPTKDKIYSTIYLFLDKKSKNCIVICGDVEPDKLSGEDYLLEKVWRYIAENVPCGKLKGIIIECSSSMETDDKQLYGHMSPKYLVPALARLRDLYCDSNSLCGLNVLITHVKKVISLKDPRLLILQELRDAASEEQLDVRFSMAIQGYTFRF